MSSNSPPHAIQELSDLSPIAGRGGNELAFFLDIDGTLLEFADSPDNVVVSPRVIVLLDRLADATSGGVALVSGRSVEAIGRLFPGIGVSCAGQHGAEIRGVAADLPHEYDRAIDGLRADVDRARQAHPRLLFEDKGRTIAIHYRNAPELAPVARWLALRFAATTSGRYVVQHGHYVEEIKPAGVNKGRAIEALARAPGLVGRFPVFIGDDVTDEDGFASVDAMGGVSIKVGSGPSVARWRLRNPPAVIDWLQRVVEALNRRPDRTGGTP